MERDAYCAHIILETKGKQQLNKSSQNWSLLNLLSFCYFGNMSGEEASAIRWVAGGADAAPDGTVRTYAGITLALRPSAERRELQKPNK